MPTQENIYDLDLAGLAAYCEKHGFPRFRAEQVFTELYVKRNDNFLSMQLLPLELRDRLSLDFTTEVFAKSKHKVSSDGSVKFLFTLADGKAIESVYMPWIDGDDDAPVRETLCISSQVGCAVDCKFCATGTLGFTRNLSTAEITCQILEVEKELNTRLTNIVFMGMGEPLLNYKNVLTSIRIMTDPVTKLIPRKRITLSTSGVIPKIYKLAEEKNPVKLAISLHATTNGVRDLIVPLNKKGNIQKLMDAVEYYYRQTRMPVTYEYIPFAGLNDTEEDAKRLAKIARRVPSRINLIPFNDISFTAPQGISAELRPSPRSRIDKFVAEIKSYGAIAIVRDTFGQDIDAACGQLALSEKENMAGLTVL